ncbi:hypothetical protein GCM10009745_43340 [Kribbella yunnanensis]|uniref:Uncharacterized protein n=1 Tax=Kribbella yunnanensis TaxID=190194 RepID=A0ABN2HTA8_9ACTN
MAASAGAKTVIQSVDPKRLAGSALVGTLTLEAILLFSAGANNAFTARQLPSHVLAVIVGTLGGWIFELFRQLLSATSNSLEELGRLNASLGALTERIDYQETALGMLTSCPRHNDALSKLIRSSMSDNFRNIPYVGPAAYLGYLRSAVEHSDGYEGIQRNTLRWYQESGATAYLQELKSKRMKFKTRLFVIDDDEAEQMERDLADEELLAFYWQHTGDVASYWITVSDYRRNYPALIIPRDFALYDHTLLITYDEDKQILSFDVLDPGQSPQAQIFRTLHELTRHQAAAFRPVPHVGVTDASRR